MADTPKDLDIAQQTSPDKNYFNVKVIGLKIDKPYSFQFQWIYEDGSLSQWSPSYVVTTSNESAPAVPTSVTIPGTSTGSIPVTLSAFPTNAKRVDVVISNGIFGTSKVAHSFTTSGVATIAAPAGTYVVQLRSISPTGVTSTVGTTFTIVVSDAGETVQSPTNPNGFTSKRILAGIEVSWAGTYASSTFTGFEAINIYAGNSATATAGTYEQVGVLTGNNVKNTIVVPLGTYVAYGQAVYIHAAAVNKSGTVGTIQANVTNQTLGPGKATDADINDGAIVYGKVAANAVSVDMLAAGSIASTSYIRAGAKSTNGLTGARVEISSSTITQTGTNVLPGLTVYASDGTQLLRAPLTGGLSITGSLAATSISTSSEKFAVSSGGVLTASDVDLTGKITAASGKIGEWEINSSALKSTAVAFPKIMLDPVGPKIEIRQSESNTSEVGIKVIKIDPTSGIRAGVTTNFKFKVDMDGNLDATDAIFRNGTFNGNITSSATITGGTINGSTINLTGVQTGSGSGASYTESSDTSYKLNFTDARYTIMPARDTWTETVSTPSYDAVNDEWTSATTTTNFTSNTIKFTDSTFKGAIPSSAYYYGETWYEGGTSSGSIINYVNYVGGYLGFEIRANTTEKGFYFIGDSSIAGQNWGVAHYTTSSKDQPAMLQTDQYGKVTRGRAIFTSGSSSTTILGSTWNNVGQNGDLAFSTGN
jgi:hypothetical protein